MSEGAPGIVADPLENSRFTRLRYAAKGGDAARLAKFSALESTSGTNKPGK